MLYITSRLGVAYTVAMRVIAGSSLLSLLLLAGCGPAPEIPVGGPTAEWPVYGGAPGGARYSPLMQIDEENVSQLEVAWTYHTGDVSEGGSGAPARNRSSFQATRIASAVPNSLRAMARITMVEAWPPVLPPASSHGVGSEC